LKDLLINTVSARNKKPSLKTKKTRAKTIMKNPYK